jgi:hypothetical protein
MIRGLVLVSGAVFALGTGCGSSSKRDKNSGDTVPDAGEHSTGGGVGTGGSKAEGGTAGLGTGGDDDGGAPPEGGDPSGGRAGATMTGGASGGGSSNAGASNSGASNSGASNSGAAGAASIRLPDGCEAGNQLVGGAYCSTEMTCDDHRWNVSCSVSGGRWLCSCSDAANRTDYEFPNATGVGTCEIAAKACADPSLLAGDETCVRTHDESTAACSIRDACEGSHTIDGVTLLTRAERSASCISCQEPQPTSCCSCEDRLHHDYRLLNVDLAAGCDFLGELCKADGVDPVGVKTCDVAEGTFPEGCGIEAECGQPIALDDGTMLNLAESYQISCADRAPYFEGTRCTCRERSGGLLLALDPGMTPPGMAYCRATSAACAGFETIVPTGSRMCSSTVNAMPLGCTLEGACSQLATIGGVEVTVLMHVNVLCDLEAGSTWNCRCVRAGGTLEVEADDSESACDQAALECPTTALDD